MIFVWGEHTKGVPKAIGTFLMEIQRSNEKKPDCLGYIGVYTTHLCGDYFINHYKNPYKKTRIQWKVSKFFFSWLPRKVDALEREGPGRDLWSFFLGKRHGDHGDPW